MTPAQLAVPAALLAATWDPAALAYIDPATGSLIIQGIIAAFVGASFALKNFYYTKVKRLFDILRGRKPPANAPETLSNQTPPTR